MKKISKFAAPIAFLASFSVPILVFAAGIDDQYIKGYKESIEKVINVYLVPLLIAVAFIVFLWGIYKYFIYSADNDTERAKGKTFALYGIIGLVIIFSVWGIVNVFMDTLKFDDNNAPPSPTIELTT